MKSSLVSATSIAAVLALEAGPTMAGPQFDLSVAPGGTQTTCTNPASPGVSSCSLTFYALPGQAATGQKISIKADTKITTTLTFEAAPSGFTPTTATQHKGTIQAGNSVAGPLYGFTGSVSGAGPSGQKTTSTGTSSITVGAPQTSPVSFTGITVAPIQNVSATNAGYVLVGTSGTGTVTVNNTGHGNLANGGIPSSGTDLKGKVGAGDSVFSGGGGSVNLADGGSETFTYTFTPTKAGNQVTTVITTKFTNGSNDGLNAAQTVTTNLTGTAVAPVQQVTTGASVFARAGGPSTTSTVTVTNIGNGNLATGGPSATSNLNGNALAITGKGWSSTNEPTSFSIRDSTSGAPPGSNSSTFNYTYTPSATRGGPANTGKVSVAFTNGNSNLKNTAQTVSVSLTGSTVGPEYQSKWPGSTNNTPGVKGSAPTSTIAFGTVAGKGTQALTLANISTDANGGNSTLTDLSIENFTISGTNKSNFNIGGKQNGNLPVTVLHEGDSEVLDIGFAGVTKGSYTALLTFQTDEGAAFGGVGNFYTYTLTALSTGEVPEPASILLLSIGLGGVLLVRRRRQLV